MKFVCPSCAATNRVPFRCAGITIICRRCKTQVTVPGDPDQPVRSWLRSPKWVAVAAIEVVTVGVLVAALVQVRRRQPPAGLPIVDGEKAVGPQLAVPGGSLVLTWRAETESAGGYFRINSQSVSLVRDGGRHQALTARGASKPWPAGLIGSNAEAAPAPVLLSIEADLPSDYDLCGQQLELQAAVAIAYLTRDQPDGPLSTGRTTVRYALPITIATPEQGKAFARFLWRGKALHTAISACAVLALGVAVGAALFAQQRISIMCPKCGRGTTAVFYHEGGDYYVSPCPHRGGRPTEAEQ